jgi:hypothetical protein
MVRGAAPEPEPVVVWEVDLGYEEHPPASVVEKEEEAVVAVERHRPRELPAGGFVEEGQRSHVRLTSTGGAAAAEADDTRGRRRPPRWRSPPQSSQRVAPWRPVAELGALGRRRARCELLLGRPSAELSRPDEEREEHIGGLDEAVEEHDTTAIWMRHPLGKKM